MSSVQKKKKKVVASPSNLQIAGGEMQESSREMEWQLVDRNSTFSKSSFKLPRGWSVEERPRTHSPTRPDRIDKYYYEPRTGRQFRSLLSIQKYLTGEEDTVSPKRVNYGNVQNMQIVPCATKSAASFGLPDNWIVQEIPRKNINYAGTIDRFFLLSSILQYYIEPGTGFRFRSRLAAERYLQEDLPLRIIVKRQKDAKKIKVTSKEGKPGCHSAHAKNSVCFEKDVLTKEANASTLNIASPPAKVKWVLGGPGGNVWNALMNESVVPDSVKQECLMTRDREIQENSMV
ncbi:methyl-CpG-binding domain-containing protein 7 [Citrus sinensis]|uniref:Methyl-CpG-binding domain-containing protein 7 n=1 Tax=Citrus sinensis TaxID=2711 RepID=A0ACB8IW76_CITSI|nr:methyl-CpG-binding domain-containing protein 7 [Citrus sinensis]